MQKPIKILLLILLGCIADAHSQVKYELNNGWKCRKSGDVKGTGTEVSKPSFPLKDWLPAVVPGTVLTSLLYNHQVPDPFYGMNNKLIPDIYTTGNEYYTYWFVKDFEEKAKAGEQVYLTFRGVNYGYDVYLNGHKVNEHRAEGMYMRWRYNITPFLAANGQNRLAVIVYPPDPPGKPNGGQGGDGMIAHNLTNQYTAGWDWIQPVHDRNTGIWDKVFIEKTKGVTVANTHVVTLVPDKRFPYGPQEMARVKVTAEVENTDIHKAVKGTLVYTLAGVDVRAYGDLAPGEKKEITFPPLFVNNPKLWWPNGYGKQELYTINVRFLINDSIVSDSEHVSFGIREIQGLWNAHTQSRELYVNGQRIFIKGGNRILSDAMLRFSPERYDAEVRMHRDMNLNLIRVWGGGITERPEFYDACDKYGLLVMQDFWVSGDCNGRWGDDTLKLEDSITRQKYPDNHRLFLDACAGQVKMLRNHPSLAIWCGGNEIKPPADILKSMKDSIIPKLDGTRLFFEYSNDDSMSLNAGDGPYTIQTDNYFWQNRSWGFNSEIGSVGIGDIESLKRFIPTENLVMPWYDAILKKWQADSVWRYHRYCSYDSSVEKYGHPKDAADFAMKAQLVNYNQYRSLIESFAARMWDWYTGVIIWKTQNPWTAMVGQMYDVYLDPNACLYGLAEGAKPTHVMYNPIAHTVVITNHDPTLKSVKMQIKGLDRNGIERMSYNENIPVTRYMLLDTPYTCHDFKGKLVDLAGNEGLFLYLRLTDTINGVAQQDENLYWLPDRFGNYSGLDKMPKAAVAIIAKQQKNGEITVQVANKKGNSVAFFNRVSLVDSKTKKRILPAFCNNNYISILPGGKQTLTISYMPQAGVIPQVCIEGWNVDKQYITIK